MMRGLTSICFAALAAGVMATTPLTEVSLDNGTGDASGISGVWRTTKAGAIFELRPMAGHSDSYDVVLVDGADYRICSGTVVGTMHATAKDGVYDASFVSDPASTGKMSLKGKQRCMVTFDDNNLRCTFSPYGRGKRLALYRLVPYLFRVAVVDDSRRQPDIHGAVRIDVTSQPVSL